MNTQPLNRPVDVREQFETAVRKWPNFSDRTLARDGRSPDYYGNPVVQGAWEGWKAAMRSPSVAELIEAGEAWCDLMPGLAGSPEFDRLVAAINGAGGAA